MPDEKSIENRLKEMMVERLYLSISPEEIENDAPLMESLGIDSIQVLEIIVGLEEDFNVTVEDEEFDIEIFQTVDTIVEFVKQKVGEEQQEESS